MVSCRVFQRKVCDTRSSNRLLTRVGVSTKGKCQQLCFATPRCTAFTFFEKKSSKGKSRCSLFRKCSSERRRRCSNCLSGPIMPRVADCLSARQQLLENQVEDEDEDQLGGSCPAGCLPQALCTSASPSQLDEPKPDAVDEAFDEELDETVPEQDSTYGDEEDVDLDVDYVDYNDVNYDNVIDNSAASEDTIAADEVATRNSGEVTPDTVPDILNEEVLSEDPEDVEEVDMNIDSGFLTDSEGEAVELLPRVVKPVTSLPAIFVFLVIGGVDPSGSSVNLVDVLSASLANLTSALSVAPLPPGAGCSKCTSSFSSTSASLTSCSPGSSSLSPYGWLLTRGSCHSLSLADNSWKPSKAALPASSGSSIAKVGKLLMASGGRRQGRAVRSVEAMLPGKGDRWKRVARMPVPMSEHCSVGLDKEMMVIGGEGREDRVLKLRLKDRKWFTLHRLNEGRRQHACIKVRVNGRPGVIVSGGFDANSTILSSVELWDAGTGRWLMMPKLRRGRSGHKMVVAKGKLMVVGGTTLNSQTTKSVEVFTGTRWAEARQALGTPRAGLSLVRVPRTLLARRG